MFIDLNQRASLSTKPERHELLHFYGGFIQRFFVNTISKEEMVAEKMAATIGRNKPRDHYDLYKIVQAKIPINLEIVAKKCRESGDEFSIINMFNNGKKLKKRWDDDMIALLAEEVPFEEVMKTLAKHFKLKDEKDKLKNKTS